MFFIRVLLCGVVSVGLLIVLLLLLGRIGIPDDWPASIFMAAGFLFAMLGMIAGALTDPDVF